MKGPLPVCPDSRSDARKVVELPTIVADKFGLSQGEVTDISAGGCGLRLTKQLRPGQYITLLVYPNDRSQAVQIDLARVKWVEAGGAGVEFLSVSPRNHELHRLCAEPVGSPLAA
jgi:c-di-GMP-binding flagellar brake protein YcgR